MRTRVTLLCTLALATTPLAAQQRSAPVRAVSYDTALYQEMRYRMIGPARGGRVTTVTGVPRQPHTFYMGSTGGGVWKTTDAGHSWVNISDGYFAVGSMGAIRVAESDPNIIYAATGSDRIRSNVSTGRGVYKSADAGKTWSFVGLRDVGQIGAMAIHPTNPDVVLLAVLGNAFAPSKERGVYKTTDGGKSWRKVLFVSDSTGAADITLEPGNPSVVYATMWRAERKPWTIISGAREGGVYKSTDGGERWTKLAGGLPNGLVGKTALAISAANPRRVYALMEAQPGGGLYRSDDAGASWTLVSTQTGLLARPFYYTNVRADPKNADIVYVNNESFYKSTDGGKTFRTLPTPHGDNHDLWINPNDPNIWVQGNDGGVNVTLDGGRSWSTQYNQPTAEIYQVAVDNQFPYRVYGAQQDNTTLIVPSLPPIAGAPDDPIQLWRQGPGCETGPIMPHPTNPDTVYGACKGQFTRMSLKTGQEQNYWVGAQYLYGHNPKDLKFRFQRVSPMAISPHDPRVIYYASQFVHRTTDEGKTWEIISPDLTANEPSKQVVSGAPITRDVTGEEFYSTLYAFRESPLVKGLLWAGANDGPVHVSRDNGKTWTNVTPKDLPPGGRVQSIEPSPHRAGSAYIAVYRYLLGDFRPYIYKTDDFGKTWKRLTDGKNGIAADEPTRVVREDPDRAGLLYAGTEFGMYASFDDGAHWQSLQLNLPRTPITDITVHRKDLVLSTQGRSFWILDDLTPLHQLSDKVASSRAYLFAPREAMRTRYRSGGRGADEPQYIPAGAIIDYWLGAEPAGAVKLDILDANGTVLRTFSSGDAGESARPADGSGMRPIPAGRPGVPALARNVGMHRFVWDLTVSGMSDDAGRGGRGGGPMVVPGNYQARLTVGDSTFTRPFVVRLDPRLTQDGITTADLKAQFDLGIKVRDAMGEARGAAARITAARKRLAGASGAAADTLAKLAALEPKLVTAEGRYTQPMLIDQLNYLYRMISAADQRPGRDAFVRYDELRKELDGVLGELRGVLGAERAVGER